MSCGNRGCSRSQTDEMPFFHENKNMGRGPSTRMNVNVDFKEPTMENFEFLNKKIRFLLPKKISVLWG